MTSWPHKRVKNQKNNCKHKKNQNQNFYQLAQNQSKTKSQNTHQILQLPKCK